MYLFRSVCTVCAAQQNSSNKNVALSKFKEFADNNLYTTQIVETVFDKVESIVGKGENAGYQHFLLFPQYFQKHFFLASLKVGIMWLTLYHTVTCFKDPEEKAF